MTDNKELAVRDDAVPGAQLAPIGNPSAFVASYVAVADELARVVRTKELTTRISGRDHVLVEGWTLLGSMLGVFPVTVWTRPVKDDDGKKAGWEARVEARTRDGAVVGASEAECLRSESLWKGRDDYALRSMAQTRATSKALRQPLGFVMTLAGFNATPAEEMPTDAAGGGGYTLTFGKHKGVPLADVPYDYLRWVTENSKDQRAIAESTAELDRRHKAAVEPEPVEAEYVEDPEIPF